MLLTLALAAVGGCGTDSAADGSVDGRTEAGPSQSTAEAVSSEVDRCAQITFGPIETAVNDGLARLTVEPVELALADGVYELVVTFTSTQDGEGDAPIAVSWIIEGLDATGSPLSAIPAAADASGPNEQDLRTGPVEVEDLWAFGANARLAVDGDSVGPVFAPTEIEVFSTTGC
jgi:hypothetical protein